jgi:hypothetical protein
MKRRKQPSLRRLKRRFLLGVPIAKYSLLNHPRLEKFVAKYKFRFNLYGNWIVREQ